MKRFYIALAVVLVALVGVIGWQVLSGEQEPVYKGRKLSEWLRIDSHSPPEVPYWLAEDAVRKIGTNGIPTLLRWLRTRDSALKLEVIHLIQRQHILDIHIWPASEWNGLAQRGFSILGTNAQAAVPELIEIARRDISLISRQCAIASLGHIGPPAKQAVPDLLDWATNSSLRTSALSSLLSIDPEAPVKAGLIRPLPRGYPGLGQPMVHTIQSLGALGPAARGVVPTMLQWATNSNEAVRRAATNALLHIDPEAPAKAGITNSP